MMKSFVLVVALALAGSNAAAVLFDGNELLRRLQSSSPVDRAAAVGYVASISDTNEAFFVTNAVGPFLCFAIPAGVTADQLGDIARTWLEKNPAVRGENAISLVSRAFAESYPCKK
ncbi:Rap1a/Tai family immunity protein [Variovorax sp. J22R24]|uniref:Rap1a/Tai family immunity protein n=1 Tax=Variovorax gracilis TaxID=3053502 RepID=UPI0025752266|nr:Rap1a/Tai family immunity protein [Variovorax sp. J22R24]MDM0110274.1 Rap1a/Tai family immunity protein [Variovorax sp. J22R24]